MHRHHTSDSILRDAQMLSQECVQIRYLGGDLLELLVRLQQWVPPRVQQRSPLAFLVLHESSHFLVELLPAHRGVLMRAPGHFFTQLDERLGFPLQRSSRPNAPKKHIRAQHSTQEVHQLTCGDQVQGRAPQRSDRQHAHDQSTSVQASCRVPIYRGECCNVP
eukprot:COSAG02_NODE_4230_length_5609_cov_6.098911_3_plen_163_part_00